MTIAVVGPGGALAAVAGAFAAVATGQRCVHVNSLFGPQTSCEIVPIGLAIGVLVGAVVVALVVAVVWRWVPHLSVPAGYWAKWGIAIAYLPVLGLVAAAAHVVPFGGGR